MKPQLIIDIDKLTYNASYLADLCSRYGISIAAVTKVFCAHPTMVNALSALPIAYFADSRVENIMSYVSGLSQKSMLLRLPAPSQAKRVVDNCDISLNSEIHTLQKLAQAAADSGKTHGVIIMLDMGDLREGIYHNNATKIYQTVEYVMSQSSLVLEGFGTNLTCYGSVLPSNDNMGKLCHIAHGIRQKYSVAAPIISGGNSSSLNMLAAVELPRDINNLRLGEAIVCGKETAQGEAFGQLEQDVVTLEAEIIEIAEKPSYPEGEININAFGEKMTYVDKGIHKRAILAIGRQDVSQEGLIPVMDNIEIIGASSDHLMIDISNAPVPLAVGDSLSFSLSYGAILSCFTSKYVSKKFI